MWKPWVDSYIRIGQDLKCLTPRAMGSSRYNKACILASSQSPPEKERKLLDMK